MQASSNKNGAADDLGLGTEDIRLLADVGFIALSRGFLAEARALLDALRLLRPGSDACLVGEGVFWLAMGEPAIAVEKLRCGPPSDAVRSFLGIALFQSGAVEEATDVLDDVAQTASRRAYADLAAAVLRDRDEARKDRLGLFPANGRVNERKAG